MRIFAEVGKVDDSDDDLHLQLPLAWLAVKTVDGDAHTLSLDLENARTVRDKLVRAIHILETNSNA